MGVAVTVEELLNSVVNYCDAIFPRVTDCGGLGLGGWGSACRSIRDRSVATGVVSKLTGTIAEAIVFIGYKNMVKSENVDVKN
ncbi:hypothetical protein [Lyngbya sp. CCY1209]|uniref:hypothetical protein n=1 Tax=Lyngbya sp. CCY1209 TaxID=2886103 RepID=UPI002D211157|nr:hypothetical protein [Lyngbya sp. CCY1209]MEB3885136.1 hypothetical protein [Lyngbya sp. CCY1209]